MVKRSEVFRVFDKKEIERLMLTATVAFPIDDEVITDVKAIRKFENGQKQQFMNAVNQNRIAVDMRDELYTPKENKRRYWIYRNQDNIKSKLNEKIKVVKTLQT